MHHGKEEPASAARPPQVVVVAASRAHRAAALELAGDLAAESGASGRRIRLSMPGPTSPRPEALVVVGDPLDGAADPALVAAVEDLDSASIPVICLRSGGGGGFLDLDMPRDARVSATIGLLEGLLRAAHRVLEGRRREHRAVEILRRQEFELREAAALQREFLPRHLARSDRFECSVLWRPSKHVSGDIYDVARLDRRHLGIFIADAVGHGMPAAILAMGLLRRLVLATSDGVPMRPSEVLGHLNAALMQRSAGATWFATAAYALLDVETGHLRVASAGHPPLVVVRRDGTSTRLAATGGLLGIFEGERYGERSFELVEGDRLLMHTDGLETLLGDVEREGVSEAYLDRLAALASSHRSDALFAELLRRLEDPETPDHDPDDLTVIDLAFGSISADLEPAPTPPPLREAA